MKNNKTGGLLSNLIDIRKQLNLLTSKLEAIIYAQQLPTIQKEVRKYQKLKSNKKVTAAWLQKKFKIGYAHASKLLDEIN